MIEDYNIKTIDDTEIYNKKVLLRVDFNVSRNEDLSILEDGRIVQALPTIKHLLEHQNKIIIISHLGQPKIRDYRDSLEKVAERLESYLSNYKVILINDFQSEKAKEQISNQKVHEIILLENIRFYPEEKQNNAEFAKKLASLGEIFVNDAFGVSHREDASVVGIPEYLPSYAGLLLKKEIEALKRIVKNPKKPFVAIVGGAKIKTKINLLDKLMDLADTILIGGALANNFLAARGIHIGKSLFEPEYIDTAKKILSKASEKQVSFILPKDVIIADLNNKDVKSEMVKINHIPQERAIVDIGPETEAEFASYIETAKTIIWNGPMGYSDGNRYCLGTEFIYYAITKNSNAFSVVGGGDTLAVISKEKNTEQISHISTGGGAMLEFIEKGTLPGIEALRK